MNNWVHLVSRVLTVARKTSEALDDMVEPLATAWATCRNEGGTRVTSGTRQKHNGHLSRWSSACTTTPDVLIACVTTVDE